MGYVDFNKRTVISIIFAVIVMFCGYGQGDTVKIQELVIKGKTHSNTYYDSTMVLDRITRDEIQAIPVESINELLESITMLDVRKRGPFGVQADMNFRGGGSTRCWYYWMVLR